MMKFEMVPSEWAREYFECAIEHIDVMFGAGFARANPCLIGAFMQSAATAMQAESHIDGARMLTTAVNECAAQIGRWSDDMECEAAAPSPPPKPVLSVVAKLRPTDPVP